METTPRTRPTKPKNSKLTQKINAKVAELIAQGMTEQAALSAVMQHLKTKHPAVYSFLVLMNNKPR